MSTRRARRFNQEHSGQYVLKILLRFPTNDDAEARRITQQVLAPIEPPPGAEVTVTLRQHGDKTGTNLIGPAKIPAAPEPQCEIVGHRDIVPSDQEKP
jgi:hypothetical protein